VPVQTWQETLIVAQSDGTAYTNLATESTALLPTQAKWTMPAGYLDTIGKRFRIKASGRISNAVSATIQFRVKVGAVAVFADAVLALNATSKTNVTWDLELGLVVRSVGSAATMIATGIFTSEAVIGVGTGVFAGSMSLPAGSPAVGTSFDSTVANVWDLTAQWGAASASNSIQVHMFQLESLN